MSTSFDSFIPHILPYAPGASDQAIYQALRNTAIDFCRRSDIVQAIAPANVVATTQDYAVTVPTDMAFNRFLFGAWQGVELINAPPPGVRIDTALRGASIGTATLTAGSPKYAFQKVPTVATISIHPVPDTALVGGLTFKCSFIPSQTALTLDDSLFNDYVEAIAAGAIARLVVMPSQVFTAPSLAPTYAAAYERGVQMAKRQAFRGKMSSDQRVTPVQFAI